MKSKIKHTVQLRNAKLEAWVLGICLLLPFSHEVLYIIYYDSICWSRFAISLTWTGYVSVTGLGLVCIAVVTYLNRNKFSLSSVYNWLTIGMTVISCLLIVWLMTTLNYKLFTTLPAPIRENVQFLALTPVLAVLVYRGFYPYHVISRSQLHIVFIIAMGMLAFYMDWNMLRYGYHLSTCLYLF
ncbi:MAG: hypothetical protein AAF787_11740 [Chloroflexota bacterium]